MNENEQEQANLDAPLAEKVSKPKKKSLTKIYLLTGIIVLVIISGAIYMLEKEGRSPTNIFGSVIANQKANAVVAVVGDKKIINSELEVGINQLTQMSVAQGIDVTSQEAIDDIRKQSLEVLVNTELLKQNATERGIEVTDEQVKQRVEEIKTQLGGEEVLQKRMVELGIAPEKLNEDIRDELLIQALLDQVFIEAKIEITEEEIKAVYENAAGTNPGLPALEEVRAEVEAQLKTSKEQAAIDKFLTDLKAKSTVEIK